MATCLFCNKKLTWTCSTKYEVDETKPPRVCGASRYLYGDGGNERFKCKSTKFKQFKDGTWVCLDEGCEAQHRGRRRIVSRERIYKLPGPNGDGVFCSKDHGWKFGRLAAAAGFRIKERAQ